MKILGTILSSLLLWLPVALAADPPDVAVHPGETITVIVDGNETEVSAVGTTPPGWSPPAEEPQKHIYGVEVIDNPWAGDRATPTVSRFVGSDPQVFLLYVFGRDLDPDADGSPGQVTSGDAGIAYETVVFSSGDIFPVTEEWQPHWQRGREQAIENTSGLVRWQINRMNAVLLKATVQPGVLPGYKRAFVGGADGEMSWYLRRGTARGEVRFVRGLPDGTYEHPLELFVHDVFSIEVTCSQELIETTAVELVLARNGTLMSVNGRDTITAARVPGTPRVYRTRPLYIALTSRPQGPPDLTHVPLASGDVLVAAAAEPLFILPTAARTRVLLTPANVGQLWKQEVVSAATLAGRWPAEGRDWSEIVADPAAEIETHRLPEFNHPVTVTVGEHAAMLILRRTFIEMAQQLRTELRTIQADQNLLRGWRRTMAGTMQPARYPRYRNKFPFAHRKVKHPLPGHEPVELWQAFDDLALEDLIGQNRQRADDWAMATVKHAVGLQISDIDAAIHYAETIRERDYVGLLRLTALRFDRVAAHARTRMLKLADASTPDPDGAGGATAIRYARWVPDQSARLILGHVQTTYAQLLAAQEATDHEVIAVAAAIDAGTLGLPGASLLARVIFVAVSSISVAEAADQYSRYVDHQAEVQFATWALPVIGRDRLDLKQLHGPKASTAIAMAGLSVLGLKLDAIDLVRGVKLSRALEQAPRLQRQIERKGLVVIDEMSHEDLRTLALILEHGRSVRTGTATTMADPAAQLRNTIEDELSGQGPIGVRTPPVASNADLLGGSTVDIPPPHAGTPGAQTGTHPPPPGAELPGDGTVGPSGGGFPELPEGVKVLYIQEGNSLRPLYVGDHIDNGAFASVYYRVNPDGTPTGEVIKFIRQPYRHYSTLEQILDRMERGDTLLRRHGIEHLEMTGPMVRDGEKSFILQRAIPKGDPNFRVIGRDERPIPTKFHRPLVELYKKLADSGLVWLDGHSQNVYFRKVSAPGANEEKWVAGVLDPDALFPIAEVTNDRWVSAYLLRLEVLPDMRALWKGRTVRSLVELPEDHPRAILYNTMDDPPIDVRSSWPDAHYFMAKMLEHGGWIQFKRFTKREEMIQAGRSGEFLPGRIDPSAADGLFNIWDYVEWGAQHLRTGALLPPMNWPSHWTRSAALRCRAA